MRVPTVQQQPVVVFLSRSIRSETIRDLKGTVGREKAELGLLITLEESTAPMRTEALEAGFYRSDYMQQDYPRIQIVTIKELLHGTTPRNCRHAITPTDWRSAELKQGEQRSLFDDRSVGAL